MIRIRRGPPPPSLTGRRSPGAQERAAAIRFFCVSANRTKSYGGFAVYKKHDVVSALRELFGPKCAYCETPYAASQPPDIEHYRPKGGVEVDGKFTRPGYYWLAADWANLLPSCIDCNRARTHVFVDIEPSLRGKANRFPIGNEAQRARRPGSERRERRILLNPCLDNPDRHLRFLENGDVCAAEIRGRQSEIGVVSIEVYGLDRPDLVSARRAVLTEVQGIIAKIRKFRARLDQPNTAENRRREIEDDIATEIAELKGRCAANQPYAGMVRQVVRRFRRQL